MHGSANFYLITTAELNNNMYFRYCFLWTGNWATKPNLNEVLPPQDQSLARRTDHAQFIAYTSDALDAGYDLI